MPPIARKRAFAEKRSAMIISQYEEHSDGEGKSRRYRMRLRHGIAHVRLRPRSSSGAVVVSVIATRDGGSSPGVAYQMTRIVGWFVNDVVITREEIEGLMEERLYVNSRPLGTTKLTDWVHANSRRLGLNYTSEMARRLDRVSQYRSN